MPEEASLKAYYDRADWFEAGEVGGYRNYDQETAWSVDAIKPVFASFEPRADLSVLDIGCGYGSHLEHAASLGWKCFGVEVSSHAREIARKRLAGKAFIAEHVEDLVPHAFDLVLILDVIEHLPSPYALFFSLFSIGAITEKTRIVITTPNAGSLDAKRDPAGWTYRHPPSHLVYYTPESLSFLLEKLQFNQVQLSGLHPLEAGAEGGRSIASFAGLLATAHGSNFTEFMRERYVPGTWSRIAEYEHLPRYAFAKKIAAGKTVLDFGCGTGYGSAALAQVASSVMGLDIDANAISWANATHQKSNLQFYRCDDLGQSLPAGGVEVVTCFEMIEHVAHATQIATIASIARLLRDDGVLIISTPNPEVTKLYGENPYHLREMNLQEFHELLGEHFPHMQIFEQRVRSSIAFDALGAQAFAPYSSETRGSSAVVPLAYVAICRKQAGSNLDPLIVFDEKVDLIHDLLLQTNRFNAVNFERYQLGEQAHNLAAKSQLAAQNISALEQESAAQRALLTSQGIEIQGHLQALQLQNESLRGFEIETQRLNLEIGKLVELVAAKDSGIRALGEEILAIRQSAWYRLGETLKARPISIRNLARATYLLALMLSPVRLRSRLQAFASRSRSSHSMDEQVHASVASAAPDSATYLVQQPQVVEANRPRILHAIANFNVGGSSRLVVDLIEYLGQYYEQSVVTSFIPSPPAFGNLEIAECRFPHDEQPFVEFLERTKPAAVHVHYWGDCDEPWYAKVFKAAERLNIPVVENINTPIAPYISNSVARYVYVSDYVRAVFGMPDPSHITIYPGSDFSQFKIEPGSSPNGNCVGMVYRLEQDKLNDAAILPFILAVKARPALQILIVGGGSLLANFKKAVSDAGVANNFEFTGYVSYDELPALYRRMALFVAPVWKESFGQVSSFAMNMHIPVCGYDVGAISEILDNQTLLAPAGDAERLAKVIVRLMDSPEEREAVGASLQARAQGLFSVDAMVDAYRNVYLQLIGGSEP